MNLKYTTSTTESNTHTPANQKYKNKQEIELTWLRYSLPIAVRVVSDTVVLSIIER